MVRIITDSAADFEPYEMESMDVACIPLCVMFGDKEYQENVDLNKDLFYELLTGSDEFPHTSQASPATVGDMLEEAMKAGDEAVVFTLSSGFSGAWQNVENIRRMLEYENCVVVDCLTATGGQRMLVEYAARLRDEGKSAREIAEAVRTLQPRLVLYACMDTLEYLHRGGRISRAAYTLGSYAKVKPILHVDTEGQLKIPAKAIGMRKGMDYMCKVVEKLPPDENFPFYVMYTGTRENGLILAERLRKMGREIPEERIINVGAAIGTHVGPNACGLVYVKE